MSVPLDVVSLLTCSRNSLNASSCALEIWSCSPWISSPRTVQGYGASAAVLPSSGALTPKRYVLAVFPNRRGIIRSSFSTNPAFDFFAGTWTNSPGANGDVFKSSVGVSDHQLISRGGTMTH
jgi:hypothetical protein